MANLVEARNLSKHFDALVAVDSVDFDVHGTHLRHHEVELEALGAEGVGLLDGLTTALIEAFPQELQPWRPSKLRTGLALQSLVRRVDAATLVGSGGDLLPDAYARILQELSRSA